MRYISAFLYHLLPSIPLALGYHYLAGGALLLVALPYVKVQKLRVIQAEQRRKRNGGSDADLEKTIRFWEKLTFLRPSQSIEIK